MKIKFAVIIFILIFIACGKVENKKNLSLSSGKEIEVYFEKQEHADRGAILFIDYKNEEKVLKERTVEGEVLEIWEALKSEAEKAGTEEAVIKYSYLEEKDSASGKEIYGSLLYSAEKIENGTWKIIKVN